VSAAGHASSSVRRWVFGAAAFGVVLRLAFALFYWVDQPLTRDEREYLSLARSLRAGDGYVFDAHLLENGVQPFGRAPGYPVFLALVGGGSAVTTSVPSSVKIAQAIVGGLGILLIAGLARELAGDRASRLAAGLAAVYPPLVWIAAYAFSEALFWPIGLLSAWLLGRAARHRSRAAATGLAAGLVAGVALLVRPMVVLFLPLTAAWLLWRREWRLAMVFAAGAALVTVPWAVRTSLSHARFVPVASEGGVTFWTGNNALARGEGDLAANPEIKREQERLRQVYPALTEEQMEPVYYREAFRWMQDHPIDWLVLEMRKAFYVVVPAGPSYMLHSRLYLLGSIVSYTLVLVMAAAAVWRRAPDFGQTPGLWLLSAASVLICLVFFPQERFRIPIVDPALIVCASTLAGTARREGAHS
jgi:4-amino-4-deoxy-L-arabinose transferase-like glycosyltransferase